MNAIHSSDEAVRDYVMGTLEDFDARSLERHVGECVLCAEKLAEEARFEQMLYAVAALSTKVISFEHAPPTTALPQQTVWRFPERPRTPGRARIIWVLAASATASALLAAGIVIGRGSKPPRELPMRASTEPAARLPAVLVPAPGPAPAAPASSPTPAVPPLAMASQPKTVHVPAKRVKLAKADDEAPAAKKPHQHQSDGLDDLLSGGGAGKKDIKSTLNRDDVLGTVKANAGSIKSCAFAYERSGGQLPPKLIVKWVIKPSGSTEQQALANAELSGTALERCVIEAVKRWRFPEFSSGGGLPVTFPFPMAK